MICLIDDYWGRIIRVSVFICLFVIIIIYHIMMMMMMMIVFTFVMDVVVVVVVVVVATHIVSSQKSFLWQVVDLQKRFLPENK